MSWPNYPFLFHQMTAFMNILNINYLIFLLLCQTNQIRLIIHYPNFPGWLIQNKINFSLHDMIHIIWITNIQQTIPFERKFLFWCYTCFSQQFFFRKKKILPLQMLFICNICVFILTCGHRTLISRFTS